MHAEDQDIRLDTLQAATEPWCNGFAGQLHRHGRRLGHGGGRERWEDDIIDGGDCCRGFKVLQAEGDRSDVSIYQVVGPAHCRGHWHSSTATPSRPQAPGPRAPTAHSLPSPPWIGRSVRHASGRWRRHGIGCSAVEGVLDALPGGDHPCGCIVALHLSRISPVFCHRSGQSPQRLRGGEGTLAIALHVTVSASQHARRNPPGVTPKVATETLCTTAGQMRTSGPVDDAPSLPVLQLDAIAAATHPKLTACRNNRSRDPAGRRATGARPIALAMKRVAPLS